MNVVQAWKDPEYRASLTDGALEAIPPHPCGSAELTDDVLMQVRGATTEGIASMGCCGGFTASTHCGTCALDTPCVTCGGCSIAGCTA